MENSARISMPVAGWSLEVRASSTHLLGIDFVRDLGGPKSATAKSSPLLARAISQIREYFLNPTARFDLPLAASGTAFQQRVWNALSEMDPGETKSYGELARTLGSSARAIGGACRANPFPVIVPCHRIVSRFGLGGFSGAVEGPELNIKQWLLNHETQSAKYKTRYATA